MSEPGLRADAVRNHHRILDAARSVIAESGAGFAVEDVARRAGVGMATIYRRFAGRGGLVRAVFEQYVVDEVEPLVTAAALEPDPWDGLVQGLETTVVAIVENEQLLLAARDSAAITADVARRFLEPLGVVLRRAQESGAARADLAPDDLPALLTMAVSTATQLPANRDAWRRYLALLLDGCRATAATSSLPASEPAPAANREVPLS